ncbi:MAG: ABC transporter ATP-binding protein [Magnetococcales bacterium]|nr:ABC transporter ATP-binding protein [Magnetococcales bacterium]
MKDIKQIVLMVMAILQTKGKKLFILVALFGFFTSIIDVLSISLLAGFAAAANDFAFITNNNFLSYIYTVLEFESPVKFVVYFGITLIAIYIIRVAVILLNSYLISHFCYDRFQFLVTTTFKNYLQYSINHFANRNNSDLTRIVTHESRQVAEMFVAMFVMVSEFMVFILFLALMLYVNWAGTIIFSAILLVFTFALLSITSQRLKNAGECLVAATQSQYRILASAFGNQRIFKFLQSLTTIHNKYKKAAQNSAISQIKINTLQHIPRLGLEFIGILLMISAITAFVYIKQSNTLKLVPLMLLFALAMYRLLPSFNRVLTAYNKVIATTESLKVVFQELNKKPEMLGDNKIGFTKKITLQNINVCFNNDTQLLHDINLTINKSDKITIIGKSGHGKSTLLDIITGLIAPTKGTILVDGVVLSGDNMKSWRSKIAYVPQDIFLFDGDVKENVLLGRKYDYECLEKVLKQVEIWDFLTSQQGLNTKVGDGGTIISGGERQRIAIARALYGNPEILLLDEITSALDKKTANRILTKIYSEYNKLTIITVTHRLEAVHKQQIILQLQNGELYLLDNDRV